MSFGSNPFSIPGLSPHFRQYFSNRPQRNPGNLGIMSRTGGGAITGDAEVDAMLRSLPGTLRDKYMDAACAAAVRYIVKPAILAKLPKSKTGNLRKGIKVVKRRRRPGEDIVGWKVKAGRPAYHAHLLEFGTRERRTKQGHERGAVPKRTFAFMRSSLYNNEHEIRAGFKKAMRAFIRESSTKAKFARKEILGK